MMLRSVLVHKDLAPVSMVTFISATQIPNYRFFLFVSGNLILGEYERFEMLREDCWRRGLIRLGDQIQAAGDLVASGVSRWEAGDIGTPHDLRMLINDLICSFLHGGE